MYCKEKIIINTDFDVKITKNTKIIDFRELYLAVMPIVEKNELDKNDVIKVILDGDEFIISFENKHIRTITRNPEKGGEVFILINETSGYEKVGFDGWKFGLAYFMRFNSK